MNKRGQFYLIASIIIIAVIIGFVTVSNYINSKKSSRISELGNELNIEARKVLEYNTYSGDDAIENFTKTYSEFVGEDISIYFITGNTSNINVYRYADGIKENLDFNQTEENISLVVDETEYNFKLNSGENFYFIISQEIEGEVHVFTN